MSAPKPTAGSTPPAPVAKTSTVRTDDVRAAARSQKDLVALSLRACPGAGARKGRQG